VPVLVSGNGGPHNSINKNGGGSGATPGLEACKLSGSGSGGGASKSPSTKGAFGSASSASSSCNGESGISSAHQQQQQHPLSGGVDGNGKQSANTCLTPAGKSLVELCNGETLFGRR